METKVCTRCGETKPLAEFEKNGTGSWCKECHAACCREWRTRKRNGLPPKARAKYTEEQREEWRQFVAECGSIKKAAKRFGVPAGVVQVYTSDALAAFKAKRDAKIISLRKEKKSVPEIAEALGITEGIVSYVCKQNGLGGKLSDRKADYSKMRHMELDEARAIERVNNLDGFDYAGGYTGSSGYVMLRCCACGEVSKQSFTSIRQGCNIVCPHCKEERNKQKKEQRERERQDDRTLRFFISMQKRQQQWCEAEERRMQRVHACPICGKATDRRGCCSADCSRVYENRTKDQNRRAKLNNALVDKDIQLFGLYERDDGVCYICGGLCDWNDCETRADGSFVAGDDYPSIDHVVPLAQGGEHSWQNVRLAHRRCNYIKSDRLIAPIVDF